jgi:hypothetical protein
VIGPFVPVVSAPELPPELVALEPLVPLTPPVCAPEPPDEEHPMSSNAKLSFIPRMI